MRYFLRIAGFLVLVGGMVSTPFFLSAKTVEELREELQTKKDNLKDTNARITKFKEDIQLKKQEARTLQDQIVILDDSVTELQLEINKTLAEVEATEAEIAAVNEEIKVKEEEIVHQKDLLMEYIRQLHTLDQQSSVTVFFKYGTFSEAVTEAATVQELQNRGQQTLELIQQLREELEAKRQDLEDFKQTLEELRRRQEHQQDALQTQRASKERILQLTKAQESEYQKLLGEAQAAHKAAEATISSIESAIREELRKQGLGNLPKVGTMVWPVEPIFGVSCEFHCGGYPYAYLIGPHAGMDIPTYVGTPIKAAADGYVARVHDAKGPGYSYVLLIHGGNISTVYGHVSGFAVNEGQTVVQGTVIAYSGGAPGQNGAGLSTGAHLHFEARADGAPFNPRKYLGS